ncbi:MAG: hypothetical protein QF554_08255 [Dehalococcoidia bacterium]|jgi:uncharacterized repeat protein (TIGR04076 family)|nr:hypothetical protein [Dehalococcoidia bacterium]
MTTRSKNEPGLPVWVATFGLGIALPLILILAMTAWALLIVAGMAVFVGTPIAVYMIGSRLLRIGTVTTPAARPSLVREITIPGPRLLAPANLEPVTGTVAVTVARAVGTCPMGQTFKAGERYEFTNGDVDPDLCPVAERAIRPLIEQMRRGEYPEMIRPYCATRVHEVIFEIEAVSAKARELTPA